MKDIFTVKNNHYIFIFFLGNKHDFNIIFCSNYFVVKICLYLGEEYFFICRP